MKKKLGTVIALVLCLNLVGCGGNNTNSFSSVTSENSIEESSGSSDGERLEVDKGLMNVEITLPAAFFEDLTDEEIIKKANDNDIKKCVVNDDGSVTYTMSKSKHKQMLKEFRTSIDDQCNKLITGENAIESFKKIECLDDMSKFDIYIDQSKYNALDSIAAIGFYMSGAMYQMFEGVDSEDVDVIVNFIDEQTNEVVETASYKEMVNSMKEEKEKDLENK